MQKYLPIIKSSELFVGLNENEILSMMSCLKCKVVSYPAGSVIWRVEQSVSIIGLVLKGRVHLQNDDFWGNKTIISYVVPGQIFGEAYALSNGAPLLFSVVAQEYSDILFMDINVLTTVCSKSCECHRHLFNNLLATIADKMLMLNIKLKHISKRTTREKLLSYLSEQSRLQHSSCVTIPFNRQELADYLSVERSAMSKELSRMKKDRLIDFDHNMFILL